MSQSRRSFFKTTAGAVMAGAFLPIGGARFFRFEAFAKSGNNGNGNGSNGNGGGNGGGNGNSGGSTGNGKGNNGNGKGNGGPVDSADPVDTGMKSVQATRSADGTIRVRHRSGITETIVSNRYVMKDAKGRTISNRLATQADVTRLSHYLR